MTTYLAPLSAILLVVVLKWYVMIVSMRMVTKSYLSKNTKVVTEYMKHKNNNLGEPFDPVTMEGYRYMVAGREILPRQAPCCWQQTMVRAGRPQLLEEGHHRGADLAVQGEAASPWSARQVAQGHVCLSMALQDAQREICWL